MGVLEKHSLPGDAVDVGRLDDVVERAHALELPVDAGVAAHVVGEAEKDVRPVGSEDGEEGQEKGEQEERSHGGCRETSVPPADLQPACARGSIGTC